MNLSAYFSHMTDFTVIKKKKILSRFTMSEVQNGQNNAWIYD